jgi:hypothetical protein
MAISQAGTLGRYRLVSVAGLTEGVTRGLLTKLVRNGYVKTRRFVGCSLTHKGRRRLNELLARCSVRDVRDIDPGTLALGPFNVIAHLRDRAHRIGSGISQRDAAIKAGALGATTLVYRRRRIMLPPDQFDLSNKDRTLSERLRKEFQLSDGDVLIIGSADTKWRAVEGVLAAAETLRKASE